MVTRKTWNRLRDYGFKNYLKALIPPAVATVLTWVFAVDLFSPPGMENFVKGATGASQGLIAVTLTGLAILVSLSDQEFVERFSESDYNSLLFIFEYTVLLATLVTLSGVLLQSLLYDKWVFFVFLFLFIHLLLALLSLVDLVIRFAKTKSTHDTLCQMTQDEVDEDLKQTVREAVEEAEDQKKDETEPKSAKEN